MHSENIRERECSDLVGGKNKVLVLFCLKFFYFKNSGTILSVLKAFEPKSMFWKKEELEKSFRKFRNKKGNLQKSQKLCKYTHATGIVFMGG